ncbi:hypothetical protein D3C78_1732290 [compost metagenome]
MWQCITQICDQIVRFNVAVAGVHGLDGLIFTIRIKVLTFKQRLDYGQSLGYVEVKFGFAQVIAKDKRGNGSSHR